MAPCCLATAAATAATTALIVVGLSAFVLATDGVGLVLSLGTLAVVALQWGGRIAPSPWLLHGACSLLALRSAWLLATTRRPLVVATWRLVRPRARWAILHLTPFGWLRRAWPARVRPDLREGDAPAVVLAITPRPE